jgi:NAD(P)-dependent dehydrogenase (short-subunit alcohol dehydrogenase family)
MRQSNMAKLTGKTLIITGASRGIGRALALELARHGINLVLNARNQPPLAEVAADCENIGVQAKPMAGDAATTSVADAMVATAVDMGAFYGFIHAAGVLHPGPFLWEMPPEHFQEVLHSHAVAAYQLVRAAVPPLIQKGEGLAVFFSSYAAEGNMPGIGAYNIAKRAVEHLARQLAREAPQIVTLIFRPNATETRMQQQAREAEGGAAKVLHREFRGYLERDSLDTPEQAARRLLKFILDNPDRHHGRIVS